MADNSCEPSRELRIRRLGKANEDLKNIAAWTGIAETKLIKPQLVEIANSFPKYMRDGEHTQCNPCGEITIRGISDKMKKELQAIADYINVDVSSLIKIKLAEKAASYPSHMKTAMQEK